MQHVPIDIHYLQTIKEHRPRRKHDKGKSNPNMDTEGPHYLSLQENFKAVEN